MANCGYRLLPNFIDETALDNPDLEFVEIPKSVDIDGGFHRITFGNLARSIDKCAWWIHKQLGKGHDFPALAYIGPHDLRYLFLVFGACKAGYKMFFASPRNSTAASLDLLNQLDCGIFLMPSDAPLYSNLLMSVFTERPMHTVDFPDLAYFLDIDPAMKPYLWGRTYEDVKHDPLAIFHTSGSTGMPKPITMSHGAVAALDAFQEISLASQPIQCDTYKGKRTLLFFPMFHASAISTLFLSIWNAIPTVLPPSIPLTAELASDMIIKCNIEAAIMPPSILTEIAGNAEYLENLWKCTSVMYGGGPLPTEAGNRIASGTTLVTVFGASETGFFPVEVLQRDDWSYVKLSAHAGGVYRRYADNLYELVIERKPEFEKFQPVFWVYPELEEYHTKDLFTKHHSKADLWLWQGRMDDIIVLSNGEKFNPTAMEDMIVSGHPAVESAVVCGEGREQCALLVELSSPESSEEDTPEEELVEELWSIVQKANEKCPEYGRVMKDMVIVAKQGKKAARADKGTIRRKRTLETFAAELDELYHLHEGTAASLAQADRPMDFDSVKQTVTSIVRGIPRYRTTPPSKSFFDLGLDSLHAMTMAKNIRTAFLNLPTQITTKVIYDFPSIDLLSHFICGSMTGREDSVKAMQRLYDCYSPMSRKALVIEGEAATVLLVGSTGHLGTQLLVQLSSRKNVQRIYCLSRDSNANLKRDACNLPFGNTDSTYIQYFHADYSRPRFGLSEPDWLLLQRDVTCVVQNAWPVDFCMPLSHFESSIRLTAQLMELCMSCDRSPTFVFVSSIGAVGTSKDLIPEEVVHDWLKAEAMGYTQSKLVAECLVAATTAITDVKSVIYRLGQLGGVLNDEPWGDKVPQWPKKEWLPAMLASSIQLGAIPASLGSLDRIDWMPVDVAAATLCEIMLDGSQIRESCRVYNIVNPQTTTWTDLLPELAAFKNLKRVALSDWIRLLKEQVESGHGRNIPAAGLVEFFESACETEKRKPSIDNSKSLALSPALRNAQSISVELMERWISQWSFSI